MPCQIEREIRCHRRNNDRHYPSARALVLARGNCILHEYYANNSPDVQWPVHSATKSVLSTLVGIAIDKGFLPLDQKLPELVTQDWKLS
ncbi:hypothetical protein E4K65_46275 [Bradyrhizobium niftali]|uniref:Uncharacterized protein n=1 Tax=Bradyrhizobium niftali TaxID=2560055 RepID=A0A4Y9KZ74_9BRAD|nr:hypothetical protein E4K65_46275 [Bradyrhizobium niftali]